MNPIILNSFYDELEKIAGLPRYLRNLAKAVPHDPRKGLAPRYPKHLASDKGGYMTNRVSAYLRGREAAEIMSPLTRQQRAITRDPRFSTEVLRSPVVRPGPAQKNPYRSAVEAAFGKANFHERGSKARTQALIARGPTGAGRRAKKRSNKNVGIQPEVEDLLKALRG